jgi:hypothetical protein
LGDSQTKSIPTIGQGRLASDSLKTEKARLARAFFFIYPWLVPAVSFAAGQRGQAFISKIGYRDVALTSFWSLRVGAPAGFFLTPFSLPICSLRELLSHRARDLSIRLFIQRFIFKPSNLTSLMTLSANLLARPSLAPSFSSQMPCQPLPLLSFQPSNFSFYLLTRVF